MKVTEDGFIWKIISPILAEQLYEILPVYRLYEDGSESLVEYSTDITSEEIYGIEVGYPTHKEVVKINNIK